MSQQKQINLNVSDGESFFAHEMSINFSPMQFILDFRCITPRVDIRDREKASINIKHNVVMTEPYQTKRIFQLLGKVIADYEKKFGEIKRPKQLEKAEKLNQQTVKTKQKDSTPSYFG